MIKKSLVTEEFNSLLSHQHCQQDLQQLSFPSHRDQSLQKGLNNEDTAQYSEAAQCAKLSDHHPQLF